MLETIAFTSIRPQASLSLLSQFEVQGLLASNKQLHQLFRQCVLAILLADIESDDNLAVMESFKDFAIELVPEARGLKLDIYHAPAAAFVDGKMIQGLQIQVFSALRDIVFCHYQLEDVFEQHESGPAITDAVFKILRNAQMISMNQHPNVVVCWGGHSISREEYDFSKRVGFQMGLRGLDIATGSGIGVMKGPMKGAAVGHSKQHIDNGRYMGITEPGIIASESPNPMVNELVIMPDIEKRLEAFVRLAHVIVVFPGGVGTAEEILYILSIKMQQENAAHIMPLIFACAEEHKSYFEQMDAFLVAMLGEDIRQHYQIMVGDEKKIAREVKAQMQHVRRARRLSKDLYGYNWQLYIPKSLQTPFIPTHENMAALELSHDMDKSQLSVNLRSLFSGIVAGNVKSFGREQIKQFGPYKINANADFVGPLNDLLNEFVVQNRMAVVGNAYKPCFEIMSIG